MCNTDRDPNEGKEKVNEESVVNFKTMEIQKNENKRKAIVLVESDVETKNSKSPNNGDAAEEESTNSSKEMSPFLLFGFIVDPNKRIKHAYSCNFCSRKFINPQALGGHQNCHRVERRLKESAEELLSQNTITPYHMGYGYQYRGYDNMIPFATSSNFKAGQGIVSPQIIVPEIDYGSVSNGGAGGDDDVDHEEKQTRERKNPRLI
ncbi:hypothetical protein TSUD_166340 [Trifolium subterraneum]|uniref:C2H2-type domain-containing protein n=1 Tax=Trifolium subterraneum TaxID=3900 RepID=A0A2Z6MV91_TRISU|nr:hypothetical protein TSUD_166340 [Trifolium subterraneum]